MITYPCPGCRQPLRVAATHAHQSCRCPRCGHVSAASESITLAPTVSQSPPSLDATGPLPSPRHDKVHLPTVPGYEVMEELGRGAMGVVYKARQLGLNRLVALKMIRTGAHASSQQRERFKIESAALAKLQHPSIVQIHEVGECQGLPFFAMDLLTGGTLAKQLRGQPLPPREAAQLAAALARGVQHAHDAGVIHRDLKPSNILLAKVAEPLDHARLPLAARIADFGLAKHLDGAQGPTCTGTVIGTPSYMAPEQAAGKKHDIGPAADIYSLGAVLYELVTGRPPFKAANPTETIMQVVTDPPVPPSRLQVRLPAPLEIICLKCLEKTPGRRYASAAALADDLERFLAGEPIQARPVSLPMRTLLWARRRPAPAALVVLTALLGVGMLVGLVGFARYQQGRRREAEQLTQQADNARNAAAEARNVAAKEAARESQTRQQAEAQQEAAKLAIREADRESAALYLERGRGYAERGNIRLGVLWMARSLRQSTDDPDLQRVGRLNVAAWLQRFTPSLRAVVQPPVMPLIVPTTFGLLGTPFAPALTATASLAPNRIDPQYNGNFHAATFSPDGRRVAVGYGYWALISDTASGRRLQAVHFDQEVKALSWTREGRFLLVGCGKGTPDDWGKEGPGGASIIDTDSGRLSGALLPHPRTVRSLALSHDGKTLITGCQDGQLRLWNLAEGKVRKSVKLAAAVIGVGSCPDGKHCFSVSSKGRKSGPLPTDIQVWDIAGTEMTAVNEFSTPSSYACEVSADGRWVTLAAGYHVEIWNADPASPQFGTQVGRGVGDAKWSVARNGDSTLVATAGSSWQSRVFETVGGKQIGENLLQRGWVYTIALSPDGKSLLTGDSNAAVLWDVRPPRPAEAELQTLRVHNVAFSPDCCRVAAFLDDNCVGLFDARTGEMLSTQPIKHPNGVPRLALTADGKILTACYDGVARLLDGVSGKPVHSNLWKHAVSVDVVALSPDGKLAVSGSRDGVAKVWDVKTGAQVGKDLSGNGEITAAAFSPDGTVVVLGDQGFEVRGWEVGTNRAVGPALRLTGPARSLAVSVDRRRVLVGTSGDNVARLVDVVEGRPAGPLLLHKDAVIAVAFSPKETILATSAASGDGKARLWDAQTGKALGPTIAHGGAVHGLAFSGAGDALWTAGTDRQIVRSDVPVAAEGPPLYVYYDTCLRAGMFIDSFTELERLVDYRIWRFLLQFRADAATDKPR